MQSRTPVYIICGHRPRIGKTLLARLLVEFIASDGRPVMAFDVNPGENALVEFLPHHTNRVNLGDTRGQMALFDQLIKADEIPKVVDLGTSSFEPFFALMQEIGFVHEAWRGSVQPVLLFLATPDRPARQAYLTLSGRISSVPLVPVYNEPNGPEQVLLEGFRSRNGPPLRIRALPSMVRGVIDKPGFSFVQFLKKPSGNETVLHTWLRQVFLDLRELELRLLLNDLRASLPFSA